MLSKRLLHKKTYLLIIGFLIVIIIGEIMYIKNSPLDVNKGIGNNLNNPTGNVTIGLTNKTNTSDAQMMRDIREIQVSVDNLRFIRLGNR